MHLITYRQWILLLVFQEEEEEEVEYSEEEEAIKQYLENDEPLPPEVLDNIVAQWFTKDPFK